MFSIMCLGRKVYQYISEKISVVQIEFLKGLPVGPWKAK